MNHDEALIRAFIRPEKRRRYLEKVSKDRVWVQNRLHDLWDLDERFATEIKLPEGPGAPQVYDLLKSKGAPAECYILRGYHLDGNVMNLREALEEIVGSDYGTMVSCIHGRLGYLESEAGRFLLERP